MAKSNAWQNDILLLLFNNTTAPNIGDVTGLVGSGTVGNLYVSLHTADPTAAGNQTSNEANYTGYARVAVARTSGGWTVSGSSPTQVTNAGTVTFPLCTGGTNTVTYVGVGTAASGAGVLLYSGPLSSSLAISNNITPAFSATALVLTES
jgi:hypothetical protein